MRTLLIAIGLLAAMTGSAHAAGTVSKARLQAAMQQHIERNTVDGAILHFDVKSGEVKQLYPTQAHPMVMSMGDYYILCADLRDTSGRSMPLDLYMAQKGRNFVVFHSEIDNRTPLQRLLKKGIARPLP